MLQEIRLKAHVLLRGGLSPTCHKSPASESEREKGGGKSFEWRRIPTKRKGGKQAGPLASNSR